MEGYLDKIAGVRKDLKVTEFLRDVDREAINIGSEGNRIYFFGKTCKINKLLSYPDAPFLIFSALEYYNQERGLKLNIIFFEYPDGIYSRISRDFQQKLFGEITTLEKIKIHYREDYQRLKELLDPYSVPMFQ